MKFKKIQKNQDNLINDLDRKQIESNISIKDNISKIDDKFNKVINIISLKKNINENDKSCMNMNIMNK